MKNKEIFFLGTKEDLLQLLILIESTFEIKYAEAGLLDELPDIKNSLADKLDLGFVNHKDWNFNDRFLILNKGDKLISRKVPQKNGNIKYAIDLLENDNGIVISLGGYNEAESAIIASKISALHNTKFTDEVFKKLFRFLKANSKKRDRFYIGNTALKMAINGVRLTEDARLKREYDIV